MHEYKAIQNIIDKIWKSPLKEDLITKKVDVSLYNALKKIPDKHLYLEEIFPEDEFEDIWENFKPYLEEYNICPIIGTRVEGVICIGYGEKNYSQIFYFDFDFGYFMLNDTLEKFVDMLIEK